MGGSAGVLGDGETAGGRRGRHVRRDRPDEEQRLARDQDTCEYFNTSVVYCQGLFTFYKKEKKVST